MARIRTIKPEFPQSESMGRVSREARLCFILLWTIADDSGRLRADSRLLASLLYPYDGDISKKVTEWINELSEQKCLTRYEIDGNTYIEVNKWTSHQKIDRPTDSKLPPFDESSRVIANTPRTLDAGREGKGEEGNRKGTRGVMFVEPSPMEVCEYMTTRGFPNPSLNSESFIAYYKSKGWKIGNSPMKDWKACVHTWEARMKADNKWEVRNQAIPLHLQ